MIGKFADKRRQRSRPEISSPVSKFGRKLAPEEVNRKDAWHRQSSLLQEFPALTPVELWALGEMNAVHPLDRSVNDAPGNATLHRNVGIELEEQNWRVTDNRGAPVPKGVVLVRRSHFELQAEASGMDSALELVTIAPGVSRADEWLDMKQEMIQLIEELKYAARKSKHGVKTEQLAGGVSGYRIFPPPFREKTPSWNPFLQVTAGIPLASIPHLLRSLHCGQLATVAQPAIYADDKVVEALFPVFKSVDRPSEELVGLAALLAAMLTESAAHGRTTIPFLKGAFSVMPRTSVPHMFMLLPAAERNQLLDNAAAWVEALLHLSGRKSDEPVVRPALHEPGTGMPTIRLTTTCENWLHAMLPKKTGRETVPGVDLLTVEGKLHSLPDQHPSTIASALARDVAVQSATTKDFLPACIPSDTRELALLISQLRELHCAGSLGGLGALHDTVKYAAAEPLPAPVLEIRRPFEKSWTQYTERFLDRIYSAIGDSLAAAASRGTIPPSQR
ncbi:hypothetical protein [Streptomyces kronopolitis]|uniref:hypothetical protein n=1 Tax=Streptomyces kronopolitis TaxID=1612435 RepID=UPI003674630A